MACDDGNACTPTDSCQAGACAGGPLRDSDGDAHIDALCGGDDCNDSNPLVWSAPSEVRNLIVGMANPAMLSWDSQGALVGPETTYDLVSGPLLSAAGMNFPASVCLQMGGGTTYGDARPDPAVGTGYWYLARARNSCGNGTYGTSERDTSIPPCP
jgi:hypothetical protein